MINHLQLIASNTNLHPYEFEKLLMKEYGKDIFFYDSQGRISGLNKFNYGIATERLLNKIRSRRKAQ